MTNSVCDIENSKCLPCDGGVEKNSPKANQALMSKIHQDWQLDELNSTLRRSYKFKNFAKTMFFVNAVAHLADQQFHHPDIEFGYNYCHVNYSTHEASGLTDNDFICAALIDKLM